MFSHKEKGIVQQRINRIHLSEFYEQQDDSIVQYLLQNKNSLFHHTTQRSIKDP
jgi:deoxycytidylate deaminase